MKPSSLVVGNEENPVEFEWTCERGIANHTRKVLEEFQLAHSIFILSSSCRAETHKIINDVPIIKK